MHLSECGLGKSVDVAKHVLIELTGRFGVDDEVVVVEVYFGVQVVDGFLNEMRQIYVLLDGRREFDVLDEFRPCFAVYSGLEFVAVIKAFAERLHLIATACEGYQIARSIMLEIELESLLFSIEGYAHILL